MKNISRSKNWFFILAAFTMSAGQLSMAKDNPKQHLRLDKIKGKAPLIVNIVFPKELLERCNGWRKFGPNRGGPGFVVNWGDGSTEGSAETTHVFIEPGKYPVEASLYYCAPNDGHITYWHEQTVITVTGE